MKKKEVEKKLSLGKSTIANLDKQSMSKLLGGSDTVTVTDGDDKRPSYFLC